jgi:hypothetical protein
MSALENNSPAPVTSEYRVGDRVIFYGVESTVVAVSDRPGILTVRNYRGEWMIGTKHSQLAKLA